LYDASILGYLRLLRSLEAILDKAEAHAGATGADLQAWADARLAPDMASLIGQVQMASDAAKSGAARLAGVPVPSFPDVETTWAELKPRIDRTIAFLETIRREDVDGHE